MCESEENYQDILQKNFYLFSRYIAAEDFLEQLISEDVLTVDDKEVITNKCIHHNRRERANKLIEILMTRGENGYAKFVEILEYQYPHVYQDVTKKEPRDPPPGFKRTRISDRLRIIRNLPNLLEQMKLQVEEHSDLQSQLCVLQQLLEVSKEENSALERECEVLKNIRQENKQLMLKVKSLETENYEHQVTINTWTTKSYHLMESLNDQKDKCHDLQVKYDNLYKEFTENRQQRNASGSKSGKVDVPVKESGKPAMPHVDNGPHYKAKVEILEQELDNYKTHSEDLSASLQRANTVIQTLEEQQEHMSKELKRYSKEKKLLDKQIIDADIKNESYYKTIQKKNDEIIELQQRSMAEQQRLTELIHEKAELFEQNHRLEVDLQSCKAEIDKIKARFSGSSIENTESSQEPGSSGSETELLEENKRTYRKIEDLLDFDMGVQYRSVCQRRKVVKKCYSGEKYADRLASQRRRAQAPDLYDDDMNDLNLKAYTLPAKANETPEKMFQREVANFRFSQKNIQKNISGSMNVNTGSFREDSTPLMWNEEYEGDSIHRKVPFGHPVDKYEETEVADSASESTVYIPRTSGGSHDEGRKLETIISGSSLDSSQSLGKSYIREKGDDKRSVDRQCAQCDSIVGQSDSSSDNSVISDFSSHEVYTALLPKDCPTENQTGLPDRIMSRRVRMKYSNLDKLVFKGGNHTGIFIIKQHKLLEINEGEQVKGIIFTPNERVNPVIANLKGCCLEDFHRLICGDIINKKKERELCLEVRNSKQEYSSACRWMENNNGHGDYFFIRCNAIVDSKKDGTENLKPNDIFLVKNSCFEDEQWQGHMVNAATGEVTATLSLIPNMQQAMRLLAQHRCNSVEEEDTGKRRGFKIRRQVYDRVLPMKASTKLPVHVFGPDSQVTSAILEMISTNLSHKFFVDTNNRDSGSAADAGGETELYRQDRHIVHVGRLDHMKSRRSIHSITVLITVTAEMSSVDTKNLFGSEYAIECKGSVISQSETIKQKVLDSGNHFEEICISSVHTKEHLLRSFKARIESAQDRILWLSHKEMDEQVANTYPTYLGHLCDLSKTITELSPQYSSEKSELPK